MQIHLEVGLNGASELDAREALPRARAGDTFSAHHYCGEQAVGDHSCAGSHKFGGVRVAFGFAQSFVEKVQPALEVLEFECGDREVFLHRVSGELATVMQH